MDGDVIWDLVVGPKGFEVWLLEYPARGERADICDSGGHLDPHCSKQSSPYPKLSSNRCPPSSSTSSNTSLTHCLIQGQADHSHGRVTEVIRSPKMLIILHNSTNQINQRLALQGLSNALDPFLGHILIESTSHAPPGHIPASLRQLIPFEYTQTSLNSTRYARCEVTLRHLPREVLDADADKPWSPVLLPLRTLIAISSRNSLHQ